MKIQDILLTCIKEEEKEKLNKVQNEFETILKGKVSRAKREVKCVYLDEEYKLLSYSGDFPYDDFAIAINNKNEIYILYSYDGAYAFASVRISELLHCLMVVEL